MWGTNKDNLEMVELLLANNADPNVRDKVATLCRLIALSQVYSHAAFQYLHVFQREILPKAQN